MKTQTWKRTLTADDRSDHHWQPRRQSSAWWSLLHTCSSFSQTVCNTTLNSSIVLGFGWSLWYFSSMTHRKWQCSGFKAGELGGQWFFSMNPGQFAFSQSCVMRIVWAKRCSLHCLRDCRANDDHFSKGLFSSLYPHLRTKKLAFCGVTQSPPYRRKQRPKCSKLVINFSQGSAVTLSMRGGQINNFWIAYYLSILCTNIIEISQHM